jgi:hypothetical protein
MIPIVSCLLYTTPSLPSRNTGLPVFEVSHSWFPCNLVLLLGESRVSMEVLNLRLPSNGGIRPNTSQYIYIYIYIAFPHIYFGVKSLSLPKCKWNYLHWVYWESFFSLLKGQSAIDD